MDRITWIWLNWEKDNTVTFKQMDEQKKKLTSQQKEFIRNFTDWLLDITWYTYATISQGDPEVRIEMDSELTHEDVCRDLYMYNVRDGHVLRFKFFSEEEYDLMVWEEENPKQPGK